MRERGSEPPVRGRSRSDGAGSRRASGQRRPRSRRRPRRRRARSARDAARRGLGAARRGGDDADPARGGLPGEAGRQRVHAALGRRVGDAVDAARGDRRDIDDHAPGLHRRQRRAAAPQRGEERAADFRLDLFRREPIVGLHADRPPDDVDQDVEPAVHVKRRVDRRLGAWPGLEVGGDRQGLAQLADEIGAVDGDHLAALGGEALGDGAADALGRAGDDGDLAREAAAEDVGLGGDGGVRGHGVSSRA